MADLPEPGDAAKLRGLRSRRDLNGRRVGVLSRTVGKDGGPRFRVRVLGGGGGGEVVKVKAANLKLDSASEVAGLSALADALEALAPGAPAAPAAEERRDWAGGLPATVLVKVAGKVVAQSQARWAAHLKRLHFSEREAEWTMRLRPDDGLGLFAFAMVCKPWRKAQRKVGKKMRTSVRVHVTGPGRVAVARWALAEGCPKDSPRRDGQTTIASMAAEQGHFELVQWLCREQAVVDYSPEASFASVQAALAVMQRAAFSGNLELVQWLRAEGFPWDLEVCAQAAKNGGLQVLQWLRAENCPWNKDTPAAAAFAGHVDVLRWARANGCPWTPYTPACAAERGQLETLQWLRANGCPWDGETCEWAVRGGHVELLSWARAHGCEWYPSTRAKAARLGYSDNLGNVCAEHPDNGMAVECPIS